MFSEATFQEMLLPSSVNINDYAKDIYSKYVELDEYNRTLIVGNELT